MAILEMKVRMDCEGCVTKIRKALGKVKGIDCIDVDKEKQKVTVMGWAASDQKKILKKVRKTGKRAELWQYPYNTENQFYYEYHQTQPTITYHATEPRLSSSYNYDGHGFYQPQPYQFYYEYHQTQPTITYHATGPRLSSSYNYYGRGYDGNDHGYYQPQPNFVGEQASSLFSDENPHACSIM